MTTERRDEELPERWSAQRKTEVVLRVIRVEPRARRPWTVRGWLRYGSQGRARA